MGSRKIRVKAGKRGISIVATISGRDGRARLALAANCG